jgi:hypothetical protein
MAEGSVGDADTPSAEHPASGGRKPCTTCRLRRVLTDQGLSPAPAARLGFGMSDPHRAPTAKQQAYIRRLAIARGISFTPPRTMAEASRLIDRLKRRRPDTAADRRRELKHVRADLDAHIGGATQVREHELEGYASTATWREVRS